MKRLGKIFLGAAMAVVMSLGTVAPAMALVIPSPLQVKVNGSTIKFPDAEPYIDNNGRVQVPVRFVSEALGGKTSWDGVKQTVTITKDKRIAKMKIGSNVIDLNGVAIVMDTVAILKNDRTFVPVRYVSEAMGAKVEWLADRNIVNITWESATNDENRGGYIFPKGTSVLGDVQKDSPYIEFMAFVAISSTNKEKNLALYKELCDVIASKHGEAIANEIYEHIKQKEGEYDDLPAKLIYLPEEDQWIRIPRVGVGGKTVSVQVGIKGIDFSEE